MKNKLVISTFYRRLISLSVVLLLHGIPPCQAQVSLELGGSVLGELGYSGDGSHYYYNNIHPSFSDWRIGIKEANLMARLELPKGFGIDSRILLTRFIGQELSLFRLPRLNVFWQKPDSRILLRLGRIQTPFGAFYDRPMPQDRLFVSPPLAYSYYTNISSRVGFTEGIYEPRVLLIDNRRDWGTPLGYELGYTTGFSFHWEKKDTLSLDVALLQGNPGQFRLNQDFFQPNLMIRATFQPTYFWKQGISVNYGGFMTANPINAPLGALNQYEQLLIGTHASLGYTYFELRTELIAAFFQVPEYLPDNEDFRRNTAGEIQLFNPTSLAGYTDLKAELPFWPGTYLAYRFDYLLFGKLEGRSWDDNSFRHGFALGIPINRYMMFQFTYALQQVVNKDWNLNQFRSALILHL